MLKERILHAATVPRYWLVPRKERAVLAIIAMIFWGGTIWQAISHTTAGASVFSLFGLGLLYLIFSMWNLIEGLRLAFSSFKKGDTEEAYPRELTELLVVLGAMAVLNGVVLLIYLLRGASFTLVDTISLGVGSLIVAALAFSHGLSGLLRHPMARGWLAIAGKTVPQLVLALLFLIHPTAASGLALITLLGIDALSLLRFIPTIKGYRKNRQNTHLRGLLLGEAGNTASGLLLTACWVIAQFQLR
ncbi:MAG TPA: hypothetical protein VFH06_00605 [Candidatus Saccharimonadales bacterium]|nr:hypothetical protein [Candidatus Saccharimonadales bacterium]